jgi:cellulase/cellobiase CelA1
MWRKVTNREWRGAGAAFWAAGLGLAFALGCGAAPGPVTQSAGRAERVENPFVAVSGYVNPLWKAKAESEVGGSRISNQPTAIWMDRVGAITAVNGGLSLREHLDNALAQGAGYIQVVIYDLPGRNCTENPTNSEFGMSGLAGYEHSFIDPIAEIEGDPKYAKLRIINIIEPDSLPNLVTSVGTSTATDACATMKANGVYVAGVQYALSKLGAYSNVYNYLDISNHGVLGWSSNMLPVVELYTQTVQGAAGGVNTVAGFISNVANYAATVEPFFQTSTSVGSASVRRSKWVDWNDYIDEQSYLIALRAAFIARGFNSSLGMLIDTSRNGWGGAARPTQASTSNDVDTFVDASRIDRRIHTSNWCNQSGAGVGERPRAVGANGIHAYVWIKPPGESDGGSPSAPPSEDDPSYGFGSMCDPWYHGDARNKQNLSGALPGAPVSGQWFSAQFQELMANAYPPLAPAHCTGPSAPPGLFSESGESGGILIWNFSLVPSGCPAVVGYDVFEGTSFVLTTTGTTAMVSGLSPGRHTYFVRARDAAGNVSVASITAITILPRACSTVPTTPSNLVATGVSDTSVTLSWDASTPGAGCGPVTYNIYYPYAGSTGVGQSSTTSATVSNLLPGTSYTFTVKALDSTYVISDASNAVTVVTRATADLTPPSAPAGLSWTNSDLTVTLSWTPSTDDVGVVAYELYFGNFHLGSFYETSLALFGFKAGTPYVFTVKARDAAGNVSVASNSTTVLLGRPPNSPPSAPSKLMVTNVSSSAVSLRWTASTDDVGVVVYQVFVDGNLATTVLASTSATVSGLSAGRTYAFTVKALDAEGGVSQPSDPLTVTTITIGGGGGGGVGLAGATVFAFSQSEVGDEDPQIYALQPDVNIRAFQKWSTSGDAPADYDFAQIERYHGGGTALIGGGTASVIFGGEFASQAVFDALSTWDAAGQPVPHDEVVAGARRGSIFNPAFRQAVLAWAKLQIDGGVDGLFFDEVNGGFSGGQIHGYNGNEGFEDAALADFNRYLLAKYPSYTASDWKSRFGMTDANLLRREVSADDLSGNFNYRTYLQAHGWAGSDAASSPLTSANPLASEWGTVVGNRMYADDTSFTATYVRKYWQEMVAELRAYAAVAGRTIWITSNGLESSVDLNCVGLYPWNKDEQTADYRGADYVPVVNGHLNGAKSLQANYRYLRNLSAQISGDVPVVVFIDWPTDMMTNYLSLPLAEKQDYWRIFGAEAYANGLFPAFHLKDTVGSPTAEQQGMLPFFQTYTQFYKDHRDLYRDNAVVDGSVTVGVGNVSASVLAPGVGGRVLHLVNHNYDQGIVAQGGFTVKVPLATAPSRVTMVSPDFTGTRQVAFSQAGGELTLTVDALRYYDAIVIE